MKRLLAIAVLIGVLSGFFVNEANAYIWDCETPTACPHWAACEGDIVYPTGCFYQCYYYYLGGWFPAGSATCSSGGAGPIPDVKF